MNRSLMYIVSVIGACLGLTLGVPELEEHLNELRNREEITEAHEMLKDFDKQHIIEFTTEDVFTGYFEAVDKLIEINGK